MNYYLLEVSPSHPDFVFLVAQLDAHLAKMYGEEEKFFAKHNQIDSIQHAFICYEDNVPVGCGGMKKYSDISMEIKRMYVMPNCRGRGIATSILNALENLAKQLNYARTILETLKIKESVIKMYSRNGYIIIPNYGQYDGIKSSVCMSKELGNG
jgi:putative acetyltransferase